MKHFYSKLIFKNAPFQSLYLYFNDEAIVGLEFKRKEEKFIKNNEHELAKKAHAQLQEYFQGKRRFFDLPMLLKGTEFQIKAWNTLSKIPFGKSLSYSEQALKMKNKGGARAVGNANGKNPIPIIIPCHRILHKSGGLGGFSAGLSIKKKLLNLECIAFR